MITRYVNARLVDAEQDSEKPIGTVYADTMDGCILYAGLREPRLFYDKSVDVEGMVLMPALVDTHTHLRDPGYTQKECMESGMRAALKGGYATLCAMANTKPVCITPEMVRENQKRAAHLGLCTLVQAAAAGRELCDAVPTDYAALSKVARVISNDGRTILSDKFMVKLLLASKQYGFVISTHCQPERETVKRDLVLLSRLGGNLHIGHISHRETAAMVAEAKVSGLKFTCEVTPHHLFGWDSDYRVNPPLREKQDVETLIAAIKAGWIDCLCTDHAPHTPEDKLAGMAGISNIEYALQIFLQVFYENDIPLTTLSRMGSYATAKRLKFRKRGLLRPGMRADLIVLDPDFEGVIRADEMISRSHNTPFDGRRVRGKVIKTIVGGELLYDNGRFIR